MTAVETLAGTLLASLDPEQRAAALLPDGPAQVIAPAGSGKTTTLIARLGVLLARGVPPARIAVVTFNRDAAEELSERVARRLAPSHPTAVEIEVRTLHAMARQVLVDAGLPVALLRDRQPILRALRRRMAASGATGVERTDGVPTPVEPPDPATLDTIISAWKVEGRPPPDEAAPLVHAYADTLRNHAQIDFDDLLVGALDALHGDDRLRARWQARFSHLLVDEFQDVDAAQLRFVRLLAEPERNLFVVGDDDQTIYAWRLADVRRILGFADAYPGAHRVQLATNYRCPRPVIEAAARLIAANRERFEKRIEAPSSRGDDPTAIAAFPLVDERWTDALVALARATAGAGDTCCFLARTRAELIPILLSLIRSGIPHRTAITGPLDAEPVRTLLADAARLPPSAPPFDSLGALRRARGWRRSDEAEAISDEEHLALDALLGWSTAYRSLGPFLSDAARAVERLAAVRQPDALVELATAHGAKGREWRTVILLGMEDERMPNRRSLHDAQDPVRALEEERRLAYVAVTRATRRLVLVYAPDRPSRFLAEMGLLPTGQPRPPPR
jgi:ATP-dependent DNA helicase UvrD/PcrA